MNYPKSLKKGDSIGICAPSSGVTGISINRLENAMKQLNDYQFVETESVRQNKKLVSTTSEARAKEFMTLYVDEQVQAIIPPWGGELLMDLLPYLDFDYIKKLPPKWLCGYSDTSTLLFVLTVKCHIATIHSTNLLDMGQTPICQTDLYVFDLMAHHVPYTQINLPLYQKEWKDIAKDPYCTYDLTEEGHWKLLKGDTCSFKGRLIGGCMDTICKLFGTPFAPIHDFLETYKEDGFIWYMEFVDMDTTDIYRTIFQMIHNDYFSYTKGILIGRSQNEEVQDFNFIDSISLLQSLDIPIIYDVDFGHMPPQISIVNGAVGEVIYEENQGKLIQFFK